jgi:hypothetical protein
MWQPAVWPLCGRGDHRPASLSTAAALRAAAQPHYIRALELPSLWLGGGPQGHPSPQPQGSPEAPTPPPAPSGPTRGPATRGTADWGTGSSYHTRNRGSADRNDSTTAAKPEWKNL